MENNVTGTIAKFVSELKYEDLPKNVIHEAKRVMLDTVGLALGSQELDKGRIGVELAREIGGRPEATILGSGEKVAAPIAAFANGELMHSMDWDILIPPSHLSPFVMSSILALGQARKASGKDLITATVVAHEVASRIAVSLGSFRTALEKKLRSFGVGCNIFGAAAGAAKILNLDIEKMNDALGLAGYFAPVPSHEHFFFINEGCMQKYGPAGWIAQGGVNAALLAEKGERGDRFVLDGETGFWAMNGSVECNWDAMTKDLGKDWILPRAKYKVFPCDGMFQAPLATLVEMLEEHDLKPEEIEQILVKGERLISHPKFVNRNIENHIDGCFSLFYCVAVAAHGIKAGPAWHARSTIENPSIREFMKKVEFEEYDKCEEMRRLDLEVEGRPYINRRPSYVEITARGKVFTKVGEYCKWMSSETTGFRATDEDLIGKFRANAKNVLSAEKMKTAIDLIMNLENVGDANELIDILVR